MLVKTSLHDSQVMYWEPAKYVAKLRTLKSDDHLLLLQNQHERGTWRGLGPVDYLKEIALDYAFLLQELGSGGLSVCVCALDFTTTLDGCHRMSEIRLSLMT